jgi:hypothetical protein
MGEERSRAGKRYPAHDIFERPTMPAPNMSGRYRWSANDARETIAPTGDGAVTDDQRVAKATFEAIKLLRRTLSGR